MSGAYMCVYGQLLPKTSIQHTRPTCITLNRIKLPGNKYVRAYNPLMSFTFTSLVRTEWNPLLSAHHTATIHYFFIDTYSADELGYSILSTIRKMLNRNQWQMCIKTARKRNVICHLVALECEHFCYFSIFMFCWNECFSQDTQKLNRSDTM